MTKVVMVVKSMSVDKFAFVPLSIYKWMYQTQTQFSGVIELPESLYQEAKAFFGTEFNNSIPYHSMTFEEDVMNFFYKQTVPIKGFIKAEKFAAEQGWEISEEFFIGDENEFILTEL